MLQSILILINLLIPRDKRDAESINEVSEVIQATVFSMIIDLFKFCRFLSTSLDIFGLNSICGLLHLLFLEFWAYYIGFTKAV